MAEKLSNPPHDPKVVRRRKGYWAKLPHHEDRDPVTAQPVVMTVTSGGLTACRELQLHS
jgi:hypothetical protein